jgi:hypothetical protein
VDRHLTQRVRDLLATGQPVEDAIALLRHAGYSKGQSILALTEATSMDMDAATRAINDSAAWQSQREADASLNSALWDSAERQGDVQPDGSVDITSWLNSSSDETQ